MDKVETECIQNDKQDEEMLKKQKTSIKYTEKNSIILNLPLRRSTRLRSRLMSDLVLDTPVEGSSINFKTTTDTSDILKKRLATRKSGIQIESVKSTKEEIMLSGNCDRLLNKTLKAIDTKWSFNSKYLGNTNKISEKITRQGKGLNVKISEESSYAHNLSQDDGEVHSPKKAKHSMETISINLCNKAVPENNSHTFVTDVSNSKKSTEIFVQAKKQDRQPTDIIDDAGKNGILNYTNAKDKQLNEKLTKQFNKQTLSNSMSNNKNLTVSQIVENATPEKPSTRSRKKSVNQTPNSTPTNYNVKKENSQPKKRGRPRAVKQKICKNKIKKATQEKYTKISNVSKVQIKNVSARKIPSDRLDDVLDMIDNDDHPIWDNRNISCNPSIHLYWERSSLISDQNIKLKYARQFLLRRNWINLAKVLCLSNAAAKAYYPLLSKYATILLAHTDKEQFNKIIQFLTSMSDTSAVMKKCTNIFKENKD